MNNISWHPEAMAEYVEGIGYYLEEASHEVASRFDRTIEAAVTEIAGAPQRFPRWGRSEAHKCVVAGFPYIVFYLPASDQVRILAVAHTSRRPGYWKSRLAE